MKILSFIIFMVIGRGERNKRRGMEKEEERENEGKRLRAKCGRLIW